MTWAPASAKRWAMARPIPREPPVTSATFPSSRRSMGRHPTAPAGRPVPPRALGPRAGGSAGPAGAVAFAPVSRPTPTRREPTGVGDEPYLRQHADNPVDWYPWGEDAFARARAEDRPVLLSVGYSACHWCHVMAHESFEDEPNAAVAECHFRRREGRPGGASRRGRRLHGGGQAMTGRGGWPMTVFLTPDGRPFFAGTYFPPDGPARHARASGASSTPSTRPGQPSRRGRGPGRRPWRRPSPVG